MKNCGGQVAACNRTIHLGNLWVDLGGAHLLGLPATALTRADAQSDALQAMCNCPWYYTACTDSGNIDFVTISWHSRGALIMSVSTGCCFSPYLHLDMSIVERCECAVTGFILFDLWSLISARKEAQDEAAVGAYSMARIPTVNLQNLCLNLIVLLLHKPAPCHALSIKSAGSTPKLTISSFSIKGFQVIPVADTSSIQ